MKKILVAISALALYSALLIKLMVFKDIPVIKVGHVMLKFGGTQEGEANFVPFKSILPYVMGEHGLLIAALNIFGNILPLMPIGFLVPFIYRRMTWKKSVVLAAVTGLLLEGMQVVLHVGIFDIDDLILNGVGVVLGYWIYTLYEKFIQSRVKS